MNFEKLLEQEAQRAALQDYEEVTEKTKNYSYKFSKEFIQKMNKMIYEEKRKAMKITFFTGSSSYFDIECRYCFGK